MKSKEIFDQEDRLRKIRNTTSGDFLEVYNEQLEILEEVWTSDYYHYNSANTPTDEYQAPFYAGSTVGLLYRTAINSYRDFAEGQEQLKNEAIDVLPSSHNAANMISIGRHWSELSNTLMIAYEDVANAQATPPRHFSQLKGIEQIKAKRFMKELGDEKPDSFYETIRRYLPRWMWTPISLPTEYFDLPELLPDELSKQDKLLVQPKELRKDGVPLYILLKHASNLEASGQDDLAYAIQTTAVMYLLTMEQQSPEEVPFLKYVLASSATTPSSINGKHAFFNYSSEIEKIFHNTFSRLTSELDHENDGNTLFFMNFLSEVYGEEVWLKLLTKSFIQYSHANPNFDINSLREPLSNYNASWAKSFYQELETQSNRPVLSETEALKITTICSPQNQEHNTGAIDLLTNMENVSKGSDSYHFRFSGNKLPWIDNKSLLTKADVTIDNNEDIIELSLITNLNGGSRYLAYEISFDQGTPLVTIPSLGISLIEGELYDSCIQLADTLISHQWKKTKLQKNTETSVIPRFVPEPTEEKETEQIQKRTRTIVGSDAERVTELLKKERIEVITADEVIQKLNKVFERANVSQKMIGKAINLDSEGKDLDFINLRQLNWTEDNGSTALRVYLQDIGNGEFLLRGILNKKGGNQQQRYIKTLIREILDES